MSIFDTPAHDLTFADVEAFLSRKEKEGVMLDYKVEIPNDLAKVVTAFANTSSGIIILGVAADKATNMPVWPTPTGGRGMPKKAGIQEQIEMICRDNIYPPLIPDISPVMDNPYLAGHVIVVVRVPESLEAPHATDGGRLIYVRTGSVGDPIGFADIERIEQLLNRRRKAEAIREGLLADDFSRADRCLVTARTLLKSAARIQTRNTAPEVRVQAVPTRWLFVAPVYPSRPLCPPETCNQVLRSSHLSDQSQRTPYGGFSLVQLTHNGRLMNVGCLSIGVLGSCYSAKLALELVSGTMNSPPAGSTADDGFDYWLYFDKTEEFLDSALNLARQFLKMPTVGKPGYLAVSFGIKDALGVRMAHLGLNSHGRRFIDEHFRTDTTIPTHAFIESLKPIRRQILTDVAFGFDMKEQVITAIGMAGESD